MRHQMLPEGKYQLTTGEAVAELDSIDPDGDPEAAHGRADDVLLAAVEPDVRDAYARLTGRSRWWASA